MASTSRNESDRDDSDLDDSDLENDDRDESDRDDRSDDGDSRRTGSSGRRRRRRLPAVQIVRRGVAQLREITGRGPDTVSGIEPTEDGWILQVELVELERVPASTSVLASYEAELDEEGNLLEYRRVRRYFRNQADGRE
jgi:gas vesicle protein GvpO